MKATDLLRRQHNEVKALFQQIRDTEGDEQRQLCNQLAQMLRSHNTIEEELFYPRFEHKEGFEDLISTSFDQHQQAVLALRDVETADPGDPSLIDLLDRVEQLVLEHVGIEEQELLPRVESLWTNDMLDDLGRELKERFDQLLQESGAEQRV
ncbi:MAG TPA: hemerythrin domain-containing protein [Polyangia bacterium]|jgi:hemerythrin superfamily protein|nr:hemerythrin domain-containing protein [Polyangia bacterium]